MEQTTLAMYDLTVPARIVADENVLCKLFKQYCKRWAFQLEKGEDTGYMHYQCRVSLMSKKRFSTMKKWTNKHLCGSHVTPTSNPAFYSGNEFYVLKSDTRTLGPWTDRNYVDPDTWPKKFREFDVNKLYRWQQDLMLAVAQEPDDRTINVIIDEKGQSGKTTICQLLSLRRIARRVPPQKDGRDIMRIVMDADTRSCYFFDLPRGTSNKNQKEIYSAIEEIKNGYAYDDRYHFREKYFDSPHIWVLTNNMPDTKLLSYDRWKFWRIAQDKSCLIDLKGNPFNPLKHLDF
jgi:hypothetical protein